MPNSTIVVNSTPIILLEKIGHIDLLKKLYGKIYVPQAVYQEITTGDDSENMQEFFTNNRRKAPFQAILFFGRGRGAGRVAPQNVRVAAQ